MNILCYSLKENETEGAVEETLREREISETPKKIVWRKFTKPADIVVALIFEWMTIYLVHFW